MEDIKHVCLGCGYESKAGGSCPRCHTPLAASCPVYGNPLVGEYIHP